jgi:hypothetical protein
MINVCFSYFATTPLAFTEAERVPMFALFQLVRVVCCRSGIKWFALAASHWYIIRLLFGCSVSFDRCARASYCCSRPCNVDLLDKHTSLVSDWIWSSLLRVSAVL